MNNFTECTFKYRPVKIIGEGFFGKVYLVDDPQLNGQFAAKEIPLLNKSEEAIERLFREAKSMHASRCPNVVPIRSAGRNETHVTLIMPYCGSSLEEKIKIEPLSLKQCRKILREVLAGLAHIHNAGIIHFDIKPSNILIENKTAMISDFGLAKQIKEDGIASLDAMYEAICPPESITTMIGTHCSDVYQTGIAIYRAINGEPFYRSQLSSFRENGVINKRELRLAILEGLFPDRKRYLPHVSSQIRKIINKAINIKPNKRYQMAKEFDNAVGRMNILLDWTMKGDFDGPAKWSAVRDRTSSYEVVREKNGLTFSTDVFLITQNRKQRKKPDEYSKSGMSLNESDELLEKVFSELS